MSSYAYIRKGFPVQTINQLEKILKYKCEEVFIEETEMNQSPELECLLKSIQLEDQLIVYDLRVFVRSNDDLCKLFGILKNKNIRLISINDDLDTKYSQEFYASASLALHVSGRYYKKGGKKVKALKQENHVLGRPKVEEEIVNQIIYLFEKKDKPMREIAEICDVSLGTVHKYIKKHKKKTSNIQT